MSQFVLEALDLPRDAARAREGDGAGGAAGVRGPRPSRGPSRRRPLGPDVVLELSHRQVDDYQTCPLKYRYVHVLRVPIRRHHTVVYGETLHRVVEHYLRRRAAGLYTSLEDLLETYEREWRNEGFLTWEHEAARQDAGREAIRRFWHEEEAVGHAADLRRAGVRREPARCRRTHPGARPLGPRRRDRGRVRSSSTTSPPTSGSRSAPTSGPRRASSSRSTRWSGARCSAGFPARVELRFLESGVVGAPRADGGGRRRRPWRPCAPRRRASARGASRRRRRTRPAGTAPTTRSARTPRAASV